MINTFKDIVNDNNNSIFNSQYKINIDTDEFFNTAHNRADASRVKKYIRINGCGRRKETSRGENTPLEAGPIFNYR